jgi:hypothetical protein
MSHLIESRRNAIALAHLFSERSQNYASVRKLRLPNGVWQYYVDYGWWDDSVYCTLVNGQCHLPSLPWETTC